MIKGKGANKIGPQVIKHRLGDKTIADVCEAFIGAAFLEHNDNSKWEPQNWDEAVKAVKVLVGSEDHTMEEFADYYRAYKKPKWQTEQATASQLDLAKKIEQKHPYHFKYPRLLRCAFVHPSQPFSWELVPNYQRLEFLGDALLDQVFVTNMFYHHPDKDPQWLTEHKMPMVSNKFLGALCVALGFHTHMRQNNAMELAQLRDYVTEIQEAERDADGAVDYWMGTSDPPKCLADIVEAFVAALFIDSEFDFTVVQTFFDMHIKRFFVDMTLYDKFAGNHPVTRLTKLLNIGFGCREFRIATASQDSVLPGKPTIISMVMIHNNVCFHYLSDSRRYGREKVCKKGLEKLDGLPPYEFRRLYGCDCEGGAGALDGDSQSQEALEKMVQDAVDGAN
jgi:endoribonuclease Dicer